MSTIWLSTICLLGIQAQSTTFTVNGVEPAYDQLTNTYLLSVTEEALSEHQSVEMVSVEGGGTCQLQYTSLPVLTICGGEISNDYSEASIVWQEKGNPGETMRAKIKWRGGSTNWANKHKRNYKISFIDASGNKENRSFSALRSDNSWILDAGQVDMFRVRNLTMAQLWNDFAHRPYYAARQPKAVTATRGQLVEVFVGDQYQGIYSLCEPVDRKQMKLKKFDEDGTIHGGLWRASGFGDATFWNVPGEYDNTLPKNDVWEVKYPKIEDLCPTDYSTLHEAIQFVATATDEEFNSQVEAYFDMPVLIDYYLFVQVGNLFDICGKNVLWAVYDKQKDKKLTPAMWDLDCCMGQNNSDDPLRPDYVAYDTEPLFTNKIFYRLITLNTDHFNEKVLARYNELRESYFTVASLQERFTQMYETMRRSGAMQREEQRWSGDSDIAGLTLDFATELEYIKEWIALRMDYLDKYFATTGIEDLHTERELSQTRVYDLRGMVHPGGRGIRIEKGRKILLIEH